MLHGKARLGKVPSICQALGMVILASHCAYVVVPRGRSETEDGAQLRCVHCVEKHFCC
jgi:hypothetical protein